MDRQHRKHKLQRPRPAPTHDQPQDAPRHGSERHHVRDRRLEGWCIQGFLVGFLAVVTAGLVIGRLPVPVVLDASTPGLFLGLAAGRVGCFFGGCCYGRPTRSRWGVWSSDQRVAMRRIPTQLIESGLALTVGLIALVVVLKYGATNGGILVAGLAAYTLYRQVILRLRVVLVLGRLLPLPVSDPAAFQKHICQRYTLRLFTGRAVTQVEDDVLCSLLRQILKLCLSLIYVVARSRGNVQITHLVRHQLGADIRKGDVHAS